MNLRYTMLNVPSRLVVLLFLAVFSLQAKQLVPSNLTTISPALKAPTLKLKTLDDEVIDLKNLKGKVVLVNFWATWCPPCKAEIPSLYRMYKKLKNKNVVVLGIDIGEDTGTVFSYLNNLEPSPDYPVLLDTDMSTMRRWGVAGIPTTFIINKQGKIVYKAIGGRDFDSKELISKIIKLTN